MNQIQIQADIARAFAHLDLQDRERISERVLAVARAFARVEVATDALDPLVIDRLDPETASHLQQAQRVTSICAEETWNDLQELCFAHNVDSAEVLTAVRALMRAGS